MITNDQFITEKIKSVFFRLQCMPCVREHALFTDRPSLVRDGTYQATGITGGPKAIMLDFLNTGLNYQFTEPLVWL